MTQPNKDGLSEAVAAWLRAARQARHLSQAEVATELGVGQPAISKVEAGQRRVTLEEFLLWAAALGMSDEDVLAAVRTFWEGHVATTSIWLRESGRGTAGGTT